MSILKSLIVIVLLTVCVTFTSYSQTATYQKEVYLITEDSVNNVQSIELSLTFLDINEVGGISISMYIIADDSFYKELSIPISEIVSNNYLIGSVIKIPLGSYSPGDNFRININPYNSEGLFGEVSDLITNF